MSGAKLKEQPATRFTLVQNEGQNSAAELWNSPTLKTMVRRDRGREEARAHTNKNTEMKKLYKLIMLLFFFKCD